MDTAFSTLSFASLVLTSAYLLQKISTPPNPAPSNPYAKDSIILLTGLTKWQVLIMWTTWLWNTALIVFPNHRSQMCHNADLLNPSLYTWTPLTTFAVTAILILAPIRLLSYAQLGKNFTFQLANPSTLTTTGLYRYVQHPSYTTGYICMAANGLYILRLDGIYACILPRWFVTCMQGIPFVNVIIWCGFVAMVLMIGRMRVLDEEEMLRKEFGKDWEEWHQRTKRFIPWVF